MTDKPHSRAILVVAPHTRRVSRNRKYRTEGWVSSVAPHTRRVSRNRDNDPDVPAVNVAPHTRRVSRNKLNKGQTYDILRRASHEARE